MLFSRRQAICAAGAALAAPLPHLMSHGRKFRSARSRTAPIPGAAVDLVQRAVASSTCSRRSRSTSSRADYTKALSEKETADFRASGINAIHHAVGIGGPTAEGAGAQLLRDLGQFRRAQQPCLHRASTNLRTSCAPRRTARSRSSWGCRTPTISTAPPTSRPSTRSASAAPSSPIIRRTASDRDRPERVDGGVSDFGAEIIKAMNEVGMLVDTSHCGDRTTLDAIEISAKPIAITHSNCRALLDHPRVKTDEAIKALRRQGRRDGYHRGAQLRQQDRPDDDRELCRSYRPCREARRDRPCRRRHRFRSLWL